MCAHGLHEILDAADVMLRDICASQMDGLFWEAGSHFESLFGKDWILPVAYSWNWRTAPEYRSMSPRPKEILVIKIHMKDIWARGLNPSISRSQTLGRHCLLHEIREPGSSLVLALVPHSASPQLILCPTWGQCHQYWGCASLMQHAMWWGEEELISP